MGTISVSLPSDGTTADVADINTPITTIVNEINGNLDNANIKTNAGIDAAKLADASLDIGGKASVWDGWIAVSQSWTYASATTITVPTDATTKYSVGDKIKLVQSGTTKYFYIVTVAATLLTITGGSDYTLTNVAISGICYSKVATPIGFPGEFAWTSTLTNLSGGSVGYSKFSMVGSRVFFRFKYTLAGAGVAGSVSISLPVSASSVYVGGDMPIGQAKFADVGTDTYYGLLRLESATTALLLASEASGTYLRAAALSATIPHVWANTDTIAVNGNYVVA